MKEEIWKDIDGYIGMYQVSNLGMVRSVDRYVYNYKSGLAFRKGKIRKQNTHKDGYKFIELSKDGKTKTHFIHRLVAQAFLPNPNNLKEVNHIDEDKTNNCVDNLEYCDRKYNNNYGTRNERMSKTLTNRPDLSKPVLQYTKQGEFIKEYPSIMESSRQTGTNFTKISACCLSKRKSAGGYKWKYKE